MRTAIKIIITISFLAIAALIILPFLLIYLNISIDPFDKYISAIGSVIVILLMLVTIILTENATMKQVESWERWDLIQRKQSIQSLIKEFKLNMDIYENLELNAKKERENGKYQGKFNNFILTSLEQCLHNSPIDNEIINNSLLLIYFIQKIHDNKLTATRTPNITQESLSELTNSILSDFESHKNLFENTLKMLREYK